MKCSRCPSLAAEWVVDPFASDVLDEVWHVWLCGDCEQSAVDEI